MSIVILGSINEDVITLVADLPRRGETIAATGLELAAGGKGMNQAIAAARAGGTVRMLGAVGGDRPGETLRAIMTREGIDISAVTVMADQPTGQAFIALTPGGDNTIIYNAAANAAFGAAEVAASPIDGSVYLTQLEIAADAIDALFSSPEAQAGTRILNAAPATEAGHALLPLADVLLLNETELQVFARLPAVPEAEAEIAAAARTLITRPDQHVVVTLGAAGCLHVSAEGQDMVSGFRMEAVDTIGAGDCFCGVFAAGLAEGATIPDALRRANAAAALSVTRRGAGESAPLKADVDALLSEREVV